MARHSAWTAFVALAIVLGLGAAAEAITYEEAVQADSPVVWYRFEEAAGASTATNSGSGGAAWNTDEVNTVTFGVSSYLPPLGNAVDLGTSNGHFDIPGTGTHYSSILNTGPASLEFWINTTQTTGASNGWNNPSLMGEDDSTSCCGGSGGDSWWGMLEMQSGHRGKIGVNAGNAPVTVRTAVPINDGAWHHLVMTRNAANNVAIYLDGNPTPSATGNIGSTGRTFKALGRGSMNQDSHLDAVIDEVAIYDKVLTPTDVQEHYDSTIGLTPHGRVDRSRDGKLIGAAYKTVTDTGEPWDGPVYWTLTHGSTLTDTRTIVTSGNSGLGSATANELFLPPPLDLDPSFESGDIALSPWTILSQGPNQSFDINNSFGTGPQHGLFFMSQSNWDARDNALGLLHARSAEFDLGTGDLAFWMQGGDAGDHDIPTGFVTLRTDGGSDPDHYMGAVLRDAATGEFLLTDRKTDNSHTWEQGGWLEAMLAPFVGRTVTLDLIDNYAGGWGFLTFDNFTVPQQVGDGIDVEPGYYFLSVNGQEVFRGQVDRIPEPATLSLLALAALGLVARRRKR